MSELVSCVMATYNRRQWVARAVRWWLRQDYRRRELIIVDDGEDCVRDLVPRSDGMVYVRLTRRVSIGEKFNIAIDGYARGGVVALWADDDWQGPGRLGVQVGALAARPEAGICGIDRMWWWDGREGWLWRYEYEPGRLSKNYLIGGSFCFRRSWWRERPFVEGWGVAEDNAFIEGRLDAGSGVNLDEIGWYVGMIHAGNTSPKRPWDGAEQWRQTGVRPVEVMGEEAVEMSRAASGMPRVRSDGDE